MKGKLTENNDISGSPERKQRKLPSSILNHASPNSKTPEENKSSPIKYTLLKFYVDDYLIHGIVINHNNDRLIIPRKYFRFNRWVNSINQFIKAVLTSKEFAAKSFVKSMEQFNLFKTHDDKMKLINSFTILSALDMNCKYRTYMNLIIAVNYLNMMHIFFISSQRLQLFTRV